VKLNKSDGSKNHQQVKQRDGAVEILASQLISEKTKSSDTKKAANCQHQEKLEFVRATAPEFTVSDAPDHNTGKKEHTDGSLQGPHNLIAS